MSNFRAPEGSGRSCFPSCSAAPRSPTSAEMVLLHGHQSVSNSQQKNYRYEQLSAGKFCASSSVKSPVSESSIPSVISPAFRMVSSVQNNTHAKSTLPPQHYIWLLKVSYFTTLISRFVLVFHFINDLTHTFGIFVLHF